MFGDLNTEFNSVKAQVDSAKSKVAQFKKSPLTTKKFNDVVARMNQIMLSGGPGGGEVDDATVNTWIKDARSVVGDVNSLYQTYIVGAKTTGGQIATPPVPFGTNTIFGVNKYVVYGVGGLALAGLLTLLIPKQKVQVT